VKIISQFLNRRNVDRIWNIFGYNPPLSNFRPSGSDLDPTPYDEVETAKQNALTKHGGDRVPQRPMSHVAMGGPFREPAQSLPSLPLSALPGSSEHALGWVNGGPSGRVLHAGRRPCPAVLDDGRRRPCVVPAAPPPAVPAGTLADLPADDHANAPVDAAADAPATPHPRPRRLPFHAAPHGPVHAGCRDYLWSAPHRDVWPCAADAGVRHKHHRTRRRGRCIASALEISLPADRNVGRLLETTPGHGHHRDARAPVPHAALDLSLLNVPPKRDVAEGERGDGGENIRPSHRLYCSRRTKRLCVPSLVCILSKIERVFMKI